VSLKFKLILQGTITLAASAALLFLPAGTLHFWEAWVYLGIVFIPMVIFSAYYYKHDPELVKRRMETREKETEQKWIMRVAMMLCILGFAIPGFDHRFGWTERLTGGIRLWMEVVAQILVLAGYLGTMWVIDLNRYAARTVRVEEGQQVINSGPYRFVRHPLYAGGLVMWLATGPALGSYVALPFCALLLPLFVLRLLNEEKVLRRDLAGYAEYCKGTPYRLIPYIW
jgi:protein-S-isoprenylcysteine O-methyltransferase Ste14